MNEESLNNSEVRAEQVAKKKHQTIKLGLDVRPVLCRFSRVHPLHRAPETELPKEMPGELNIIPYEHIVRLKLLSRNRKTAA